jgi:hypothetical protein
MKKTLQIFVAALLAGCFAHSLPLALLAQSAGRVEFTARVAPTGGRPEPVRQLTFSLLRKSFDDIRTEALQDAPAPNLDQFADSLSVSPELKSWMKKHHSAELAGPDFIKSLTPDDLVDVPEFFHAYIGRNIGLKSLGLVNSKPKTKGGDSSPEKVEQARKEEYRGAIQKYLVMVPESTQGLDLDLTDINPYSKWQALVNDRQRKLDARISELAQQRYLAAQTDSDLEGRGSFAGIAPGSYWIALLGADAISGDIRLRWDIPVTVQPGETSRVELSNVNAIKPATLAQASNP